MKILIKNCNIIDNESFKYIDIPAYIGIEDQYIKFVGEYYPEHFQPDRIIDASNKIAMPGFANSHTHSAMTLFRNFANDKCLNDWLFNYIFPLEAKLNPQDVYWGTCLAIAEMISSGTTNFVDMYMYMEQVAKAVDECKIRATLAYDILHSDTMKISSKEACDYYEKWHLSCNEKITVYIQIHSVYLHKIEAIKRAVDMAKSLDTGICIHLCETASENVDILNRHKMTPVELCEQLGVFDVPVIAAHCIHVTDSDLDILQKRKASVAYNPTSNLKLGSGIAPIPDMIKRGINVCVGTDGAASNNNLNMLEEMHIAALIHKGIMKDPLKITARQAISMCTSNGAIANGLDEKIGKLVPGMKADIILIDTSAPHFNPINDVMSAVVYTAQGSDVNTVIIDGNIIMENREFRTIDYERIVAEVKAITKRLFAK